MSLVTIQVGQCGNQIGDALYQVLSAERPFGGEKYLFGEDGKARCVLVDGEAKVVGALLRHPNSPFKEQNAFFEHNGRGNNWALGYYGPSDGSGNVLVDRAMEGVRKELETASMYKGCVLLHSLCGGTGAGLGSRIMEEVRDEIGHGAPLMSISVVPFETGELPLQHYNSALCLSRVLSEADTSVLFSNDAVLSLCARRMAKKLGAGGVAKPADVAASEVRVADLNRYIAMALAGLVQPCAVGQGKASVTHPLDLHAIAAALSPMRESKFVDLWSVHEPAPAPTPSGTRHSAPTSFAARPWLSLADQLSSEMPKFVPRWRDADASGGDAGDLVREQGAPRRVRGVGYGMWARGVDAAAAGPEGAGGAVGAVEKAVELLPWAPPPCTPPLRTSALQPLQRVRRSLTVAAARSTYLERFKSVTARCDAMFSAGAYLHWFTKYGMEESELGAAVEEVDAHVSAAEEVFGD